MGNNKKRVWITAVILIFIEQVIKIVINNNYLDANTPILPPWLYFNPMFNRDYSWFNSMFQWGVGKWVHIVVVGLLLVIMFIFYKFLNRESSTPLLGDIAFAFLFSGATCSLIDKIFWNGSLDYIMVNGFFTFDLKDVYVNIFNGFLILMVLIDYKGLWEKDDKDILKDFIGYIKEGAWHRIRQK